MTKQNQNYSKQEIETPLQKYRKAADQGLAEAQSTLGDMYLKGNGVAQDNAEAVKWLRKSANQGNAIANLILQGLTGSRRIIFL